MIPYFVPRNADEAEAFAEYVRDAQHAERHDPPPCYVCGAEDGDPCLARNGQIAECPRC